MTRQPAFSINGMNHSFDMIIIGGGPAGSAAAALLARAGRRVALLEKECFPRDKLCGEFLSGEALPLLERIGCMAAIQAAGPARITQWRFSAPSGRVLEGRLPRPAAGLSRRALDRILFLHAAGCGAVAQEGAEVRQVETLPDHSIDIKWVARGQSDARLEALRAPMAIAAWGRRSAADKPEARRRKTRPAPYIGVKLHHTLAEERAGHEARTGLDDTVEIHTFPGGYCGMSFVEEDRVNVCMLLDRRFVERHAIRPAEWGRLAETLARANRLLARRLEGLVPAAGERPLTVAQPAFGARRKRDRTRGPLLYLGDAAGMIPPLCGDGQAMALNGAVDLCELIAPMPPGFEPSDVAALLGRWERLWARRYGGRIRVGRALQAVLGQPLIAEAGLRVMGFMPWAAAGLVRATRGA